ncbi:UNVERIFIED_ORG: hypothetical protein GGI66_001770 [Rhizobium esperanzae]
MAMLLCRLDHEIDECPGDTEFGCDILLGHAVQAMADEGVVGALRQRLERGKHITKGLGGDQLIEHGGDGRRHFLDLVDRPIVVHPLAPSAALVEGEIIDHPKCVTDRATDVVGFDPVSFDHAVLKYIFRI